MVLVGYPRLVHVERNALKGDLVQSARIICGTPAMPSLQEILEGYPLASGLALRCALARKT